jgi:hypothetical protein
MNRLNLSHHPNHQSRRRMNHRCHYRRPMIRLSLIRHQSCCRHRHHRLRRCFRQNHRNCRQSRLNQSRYRRPVLLDLLSSRNSSLLG